MANKRKAGKRVNGRLSRARADVQERNPPTDRILARRELFSFVSPAKGGQIDQDICDGIGQLHALGLLDGHGIDAIQMRDAGREYAELYWKRYQATAPKTGAFERASRSSSSYDGETSADRRFARMDEALTGYDRQCLFHLAVETEWTDEFAPWVHALIDDALRERGKHRPGARKFVTMCQLARLRAAIRGLAAIVDGALPMRWEKAA